jgi:transcriptional regulator with XRE-family HTH domain
MANMPKQNLNRESTPAAVVEVLRQLGANINTARLRRHLTLEDLAAKAGVSKETVVRVEAGRVTTSITAYATALWALGLHHELADVGSPETDQEGLTLAAAGLGRRARPVKVLDDDF